MPTKQLFPYLPLQLLGFPPSKLQHKLLHTTKTASNKNTTTKQALSKINAHSSHYLQTNNNVKNNNSKKYTSITSPSTTQ
jgi:hypothetical protein